MARGFTARQLRNTFSLKARLDHSYGVQYGHSSLTGHSRVPQNRSCIFLAADLESYCSLLSDYLVNIEGPKVVLIFAHYFRPTAPDFSAITFPKRGWCWFARFFHGECCRLRTNGNYQETNEPEPDLPARRVLGSI